MRNTNENFEDSIQGQRYFSGSTRFDKTLLNTQAKFFPQSVVVS